MLTFILFVLAVCYLLVDIPLTLIDMYLTIRMMIKYLTDLEYREKYIKYNNGELMFIWY